MVTDNQKDDRTRPPLKGIRVIDLTRIVSGPYCSMALGDLGVEIIKIEQPKTGDETRAWGPFVEKTVGAYYICLNRNKKSLTLNLKHPEALAIFKKLVKMSDVVLENFRPGTMDELGLGYEVLQEINPRLIYCDITGYGNEGPYRDKPGVDIIVSAIGGLMGITGEPDGRPVKAGVALTDVMTGLYAFGAISSALFLREQTGRGQRISVNLLSIQLATLINIASNYLIGGILPRRMGTTHPSIVPYEAHPAKDEYMMIGVINNKMWRSFCKIVKMEEFIDDPRFADNEKRIQNRQALYEIIDQKLAAKNVEEWVPLFDQAGIPSGPINPMDRVFKDPQVQYTKQVKEVEHPVYGKIKMVGPPVSFSESKIELQSPPAILGEHNREILTQLLGYTNEQVDVLQNQGVI